MSPTINTSSMKASENPIYKNLPSHARKTSDSGSEVGSTSSSTHSSLSSGGGAAPRNLSVGYAPAAASYGGVSAQLKKPAAARGIPTRGREQGRRGDQMVFGAARLVHLPTAQSRVGDRVRDFSLGASGGRAAATAAKGSSGASWEQIDLERESQLRRSLRLQDRPAFPASASVSLPTSTTALEYLLYEHDSLGTGSKSKSHQKANTDSASGISYPLATPLSSRNQSTSSVFSGVGLTTPTGGSSDYLKRYHSSRLNVGDYENACSPSDQPVALSIAMTTKNAPAVTMGTERTSTSSEHKLQQQQQQHQQHQPEAGGHGHSRKPSTTPSNSRRGRLDSKSAGFQFFYVEPCLYTHRMFLRAAKIFDVLKSEESETKEAKATRRRRGESGQDEDQKIPDMEFRDAHEQIKTFELTFATLKYQDLFREIFERTGFFYEFSNLRSDYSLVCIILFDLQSRKFQRRTPLPVEQLAISVSDDSITESALPNPPNPAQTTNNNTQQQHTDNSQGTSSVDPDEIVDHERPTTEDSSVFANVKYDLDDACLEIENALLSRKTRFQSSIAKERIRRNAPSLEHLLPEQVRNKDETKSSTPVFCWVNQIKTKMDKMIESLLAEGFEELQDTSDISEHTTNVFRRDKHCSDLLVFPPHLNMYFKDSDWVRNAELVQQDKSSCLAPQTVQFLLGIDQDVIHVNVGTGMTTGHIASLVKQRSPHTHIWAFGGSDVDRLKKAARNLEFLGTKNSKIIHDDFLNVDPEEHRYRNVRVIMITANCSKSAITSPVQFIVSEGEDMQILGELSQADSGMARVQDLTIVHENLLKHALKFPRVRAVVYTTRSRYQVENEQVVTRVLEAANGGAQNGRRVPFKVTPPVLPFASDEIGTNNGIVDGRFACFRPTEKANGCFIAIIAREPDDPKEAAKSAIARARSKGMLGGAKGDVEASAEGDSPKKTRGGRAKRSSTTDSGKSSGGGAVATNGGSGGSNGLKQKLSSHRSAAAVGARLYQAGVISRMEQQARMRPHRPEHVKVVKHPAPFSKTQQEVMP